VAPSSRPGRSRLTLALLVITSIAVLTLDFRDAGPVESVRRAASSVFSPLRGAAETASRPFTNAWHGVTGFDDLEDENDRLRAELDGLQGRKILEEDAAEQLAELLAAQDLPWVEAIPRTTARVAAGPPSNFSHTVDIDKGSDDGIAVGMPVVNGAGLVGRVVQVTSGRATVQLVTDPDFKVGVRLLPDGTLGTATGRGPGDELIVDAAIDEEEEVRRGAALTTSGADQSAFPASIPVGRVRSTRESSSGLTLELLVEPAADTQRLSFVTVLLWEGAG
jgi:rod shape-determining protein MreC